MKKQTKAKPLKYYKDRAMRVFSEYIRRKDAVDDMVACFTCGKVRHWKQMDCGHGIQGRGAYILFLEEICRPQCKQCNLAYPYGKNGNYSIFVPKLIRQYGVDQYDYWVAEDKKPLKRYKSDYQDIESYYSLRLSEL